MVRSILWISSIAPSSPFSSVCAALPQPRSRMALAADTRAAAVACLLRVLRARDEADDVGAHENPSHTAIAIYGVDSPVPKRHFRTNGLIGSLSESSPSSPAASGLSGSRLPIAQPAADQLSCRETAITGR